MRTFRGPLRQPVRRLGLRARIVLAFTLGALVLSALLASVTYALVRENLVRQRERAALSQVYGNAKYVRDSLRSTQPNVVDLLSSLQTPAAAQPVLYRSGELSGVNVEFGERELPRVLRERVLAGVPARMRFDLRGDMQLAVGVPLPSVDAAYFEIVSLEELQRTLRSLGFSLLAAALVTTVAGAALGVWASRRVLQPLSDVNAAARAIAGGRLDTRLQEVRDADLDPIVESFNDMATALQERIERDARFASDVSHELRSPLTTLSASTEVLKSRWDEMPERARAALDLLVADLARFQSMVEDLLEISRFDAGASLVLEPVRIAELVLYSVEASSDKDVPVDIAADAGDTVVMADKRRLVRVIANLLDNAEKHGDGATRVGIELAGDDRVRVMVDDAGPGVPAEDRDNIFERFARGVAAGRRGRGEGVGLGLALVRAHVELHGGTSWVDELEAGGARFVVELPVVPVPADGEDGTDDEAPLEPTLDEVTPDRTAAP